MATLRQVRKLAELARDLDMVVFQLEREPHEQVEERRRLRRELERLRDQLTDVVRELE